MMVADDGQRLAFDKRELAVLTGMMAKEDRPNLAALWFHGGRAQAWATDGHRAVIVDRDDKPPRGDATARPVAIPAVTALHVAKTAGARDLVVIDLGGPEVKIELRERTSRTTEIKSFGDIDARTKPKHVVTCKRHEGGYPSIEFAFPSYRERGGKGAVVAFDPALLGPVMALASVAEGFVWLNISHDDGPLLFLATAEDGAVWRIVVMPKRAGGLVPPDRQPPPMPGSKTSGRARAKASDPGKPATPAPTAGASTKPPELAGHEPAKATEPTGAVAPARPRGRGRGKLRAAS